MERFQLSPEEKILTDTEESETYYAVEQDGARVCTSCDLYFACDGDAPCEASEMKRRKDVIWKKFTPETKEVEGVTFRSRLSEGGCEDCSGGCDKNRAHGDSLICEADSDIPQVWDRLDKVESALNPKYFIHNGKWYEAKESQVFCRDCAFQQDVGSCLAHISHCTRSERPDGKNIIWKDAEMNIEQEVEEAVKDPDLLLTTVSDAMEVLETVEGPAKEQAQFLALLTVRLMDRISTLKERLKLIEK